MYVKALFVDHDPHELDKTRRLVEGGQHVAAAFVTPEHAYEQLERTRFDLLVVGTGGRISPSVEIAELVAAEHPDTARLVMSDDAKIVTEVPAHFYLPRRVDASVLTRAMFATVRWRNRMGSAHISELVTAGRKLPSIPATYLRLKAEVESADPSLGRIGHIIEADPGVSVRVLTMVNSALFGLHQEVGDVVQATTLLGMKTVSSLVLAAGVFEGAQAIDARYVEVLWKDSLAVSTLARTIAARERLSRSEIETAQLAGLLHDVGELVLLKNWPDEFRDVDMSDRDVSERHLFGATHAEIGAFLANLWLLEERVVEAIANHHHPSESPHPDEVSAASAVHVARALVDADGDLESAELDISHVAAIGLERVRGWATLARTANAA